jgi:hypothetical protein
MRPPHIHGLTFLQDHFGLILNEPAGKIAILVVEHSVKLIVQVSRSAPYILADYIQTLGTYRLGPTTATPGRPSMWFVILLSVIRAYLADQNKKILEAFHHPYYATGRSSIQNSMFEELERWIAGLEGDVARETIEALTKVRLCCCSPQFLLHENFEKSDGAEM